MKGSLRLSILSLAVIAGSAAVADDELKTALAETKYSFNWRVRYEAVDQAGFMHETSALTSRVRAGFESGVIAGTKLLAEMTGTTEMSSEFNSTTNGHIEYPVVADPGGFAEINRFALINDSLERTTLTLGRQRLILDDARFVGNVGWRQNEQTFDGLASRSSGEKFTADFAYFDQINRIFGPDSPVGEWNGDVFIVNASRSFAWGKLTAFAYGIDIDEAAAASTDTLGLRLAGSRIIGETSLLYTVSFAEQRDAGLNPNDLAEDYSLIEAGFSRGKFTTAVGFEVLSGNGTTAFSTPFATGHAFQGWADKFLTTPVDGIDDSYLRVAYRPGMTGPFDSVDIVGVYHEFDADFGSAEYGDELDLSLVGRANRVTLTLKYAAYEAAVFAIDTDKLWFSMDYAF